MGQPKISTFDNETRSALGTHWINWIFIAPTSSKVSIHTNIGCKGSAESCWMKEKPLQGTAFQTVRDTIMNIDPVIKSMQDDRSV
jgi:hypothetical protein